MSTPRHIDFGYTTITARTRWSSLLLPVRVITLSTALFVVAAVVVVIATTHGDYPLTLGQVGTALTGGGEEFHRTIVLEWRLPVAVAALVFGAVLGIGGAIFQSLTRNPLGSPDIIGFDAGSYFAVVVTMLIIGTRQYWAIATAAIAGGLITALVVYVLAYRRGIQGFRLIIVGIGVSAVLGSLNAYLITRADVHDAMSVGFWAAGSLTKVSWSALVPSLAIAAVIVLSALALSSTLRHLELGDDTAIAQGARPGPARIALITAGVSTTALVTAAAGPIAFIALVAPQIARRLVGSAGVSMLSSAAMGAALLSAAHLLSLLVAQAYRPVPVGLITVCLGGIYLLVLIVRESRRHQGVPR